LAAANPSVSIKASIHLTVDAGELTAPAKQQGCDDDCVPHDFSFSSENIVLPQRVQLHQWLLGVRYLMPKLVGSYLCLQVSRFGFMSYSP